MKIIIISKFSKKFISIGFLLVIIIFASFYALFKHQPWGVFAKENRKLPIYSVDTKDKKIAITFDSTWGDNNTVEILNILDKEEVKATFFLLGKWIEKHPKEAEEIYKRGHEIGNHSDSHPDMKSLSSEKLAMEIAIADEKIKKLSGKGTKLFRFPSGEYNDKLVEAAEKTNHISIQWDVDSIDWKEQGEEIEYNRVIKKAKAGSIILFHNGAKFTPKTLSRVIKKLKEEGYKFVKVSELIYKEDYYIDSNGTQKIKE